MGVDLAFQDLIRRPNTLLNFGILPESNEKPRR
jgi:hypothetical protein